MSDEQVIEAAAFEMNRSGQTLEDAQHLESDGRLFELYEDDPAGRSRFFERCTAYGLGGEAQALLEKFA